MYELLCVAVTCGAVRSWKRKALLRQLRVAVRSRRDRSRNVSRERAEVVRELRSLPDYVFKSMFRFVKTTFDEVLRKVTPHFRGRSVKMANLNTCRVTGSNVVSTELKLFATLRYLAGGMKWDICLALKLGFGTFFSSS